MSETINSSQVLQVFESPQFGQIRANGTSDEPLFCAADVCKALGYSNGRDAIAKHCDEGDVAKCDTLTPGGTQSLTYVNESGLYALIFGSKLESAKEFKRWVTSEVLPSIRKQGGYMVAHPDETPEMLFARALKMADETMKRQQQQIDEQKRHIAIAEETIEQNERQLAEQAPKVMFADAVSSSEDVVLVKDLATILTQNGYKTGQNRLFDELREDGFLGKRGAYYNKPTQKAMDMGLFEVCETNIQKPSGTFVATTTKVTGKGQVYFVNYFLTKRPSQNK